MDENIPNQGGVNNSPVQPAQNPNPVPNQPVGQTVIVKKSSPWPWIVGGCLIVVLLIIASIIFAGWWGAKKVKNEIEKYEPTMEGVKNNIDKMNKEAEEWEKKSQELQKNMPDTGDGIE